MTLQYQDAPFKLDDATPARSDAFDPYFDPAIFALPTDKRDRVAPDALEQMFGYFEA